VACALAVVVVLVGLRKKETLMPEAEAKILSEEPVLAAEIGV
jgi:hypothetical protein